MVGATPQMVVAVRGPLHTIESHSPTASAPCAFAEGWKQSKLRCRGGRHRHHRSCPSACCRRGRTTVAVSTACRSHAGVAAGGEHGEHQQHSNVNGWVHKRPSPSTTRLARTAARVRAQRSHRLRFVQLEPPDGHHGVQVSARTPKHGTLQNTAHSKTRHTLKHGTL
jgi:hypothetical protein